MNKRKISELTQASNINSEDRVLLNQNGETKTTPFSALSSKLNPTIINNLTNTSTTSALSANQGKILKDKFDAIATKTADISNGALGDYTIYEPPLASNEWVTDATGKILDVSAEDICNLFYNNYLGTNSNGITVTKTILGKDQSNTYNIYEYDFCPSTYNKTILLSSGMHPYELPATFGLAHFVKHLMDSTVTHNGFKYLRENVRIKIIPVVNPWGFNQSPKRYGNVNGVNINRNFDYNGAWSSYPTQTDNEWNYKGTAPFGEAETKILRDWFLANSNAALYIDCHTGLKLGPYDNFLYYISTTTIVDKIQSALTKLSNRIMSKYGATTSVNEVRINHEGNIKGFYVTNVVGIPNMVLEFTEKNTKWGTTLNNESGDITEYEVALTTYIFEVLKDDLVTTDDTITLRDYIISLEQRVSNLENR